MGVEQRNWIYEAICLRDQSPGVWEADTRFEAGEMKTVNDSRTIKFAFFQLFWQA